MRKAWIEDDPLGRVAGLALGRLEMLLQQEQTLDSQELKRIVSTLKELKDIAPPAEPEEEKASGVRVVLEGELQAFSG